MIVHAPTNRLDVNKTVLKISILVCLCLTPLVTVFAKLPTDARHAGGIAVVPVAMTVTAVTLQDKPVALVIENNQRYAVVGIPLSSSDHLILYTEPDHREIAIALTPFHYAEQHLTITDQSKVTPDKDELARYAREAKEQNAVYASFSHSNKISFPDFIKPTHGVYTSPFGFKRFFNGEARAPHAGLDIAAPIGQGALAPADGVVVQTGDYFFNGQTVMIDHGQGIVSMLCHLSRIDVSAGDVVKQGQVVALVGKSGRATGPHLHWSVSLNDTRIEPKLLLMPEPIVTK